MTFVEELESYCYTSESLDDIVHDAASILASAQNNEAEDDRGDDENHDKASLLASNACNKGLEGQIKFLIEKCGWTERNIVDALQDRSDRWISAP